MSNYDGWFVTAIWAMISVLATFTLTAFVLGALVGSLF